MSGLDEAMRAMLRDVVREEVRAAVRECLAEVLASHKSAGGGPGDTGARNELLTVHEVALELKVTEPTVREWIKSGALRAERLGGRGQKRLLRIAREHLDEFKRRRSAGGDPDAGSVDEQAKNILSTVRAKGAKR